MHIRYNTTTKVWESSTDMSVFTPLQEHFMGGDTGFGTIAPMSKVHIHSTSLVLDKLVITSVAPSMILGDSETFSGFVRRATLGFATGANHFLPGSAAGDLIIHTQHASGSGWVSGEGSIIFAVPSGNTYAIAEAMRVLGNKRIGIGTPLPVALLDVNGDFALRVRNLTLANGDNHNVDPGAFAFQRLIGPTAAFAITGISGGVNGRILYFFRIPAFALTIKNNNAGSSVGNRIFTATGADVAAPQGMLIFSTSENGWLLFT